MTRAAPTRTGVIGHFLTMKNYLISSSMLLSRTGVGKTHPGYRLYMYMYSKKRHVPLYPTLSVPCIFFIFHFQDVQP